MVNLYVEFSKTKKNVLDRSKKQEERFGFNIKKVTLIEKGTNVNLYLVSGSVGTKFQQAKLKKFGFLPNAKDIITLRSGRF